MAGIKYAVAGCLAAVIVTHARGSLNRFERCRSS